MTRAVFDSTVLISAFLRPGGVSDELIRLAAGEAFTLVLAAEILDETRRRSFSPAAGFASDTITPTRTCTNMDALRILAEFVSDLPLVSGVVRDPDDDMVIACALKSRAQYIVTRDDDLLSLKTYQDTAMIAPEQFRMLLRGQT